MHLCNPRSRSVEMQCRAKSESRSAYPELSQVCGHSGQTRWDLLVVTGCAAKVIMVIGRSRSLMPGALPGQVRMPSRCPTPRASPLRRCQTTRDVATSCGGLLDGETDAWAVLKKGREELGIQGVSIVIAVSAVESVSDITFGGEFGNKGVLGYEVFG